MGNRARKYWISGIVACILFPILFFVLIHFPHLFIKKNFTYKSFHIYSNTGIDLSESVKKCLDSVDLILKTSDFHDSVQVHHLYFVRGTFYERMIRSLGRKNMAFAFRGNNQIYSAFPDFEKGVIHRNNNELEVMSMIQVFSHEAVHNQMRLQYANFGIPTTPHWINEGYCEYVAYQSFRTRKNYQLKNLVLQLESSDEYWLPTAYGMFSPREYLLDRAVVEFLIDVKGMDIHGMIGDGAVDPEVVWEEMKVYFDVD